MESITKIINMGREQAEPLEEAKRKAEREALDRLGDEAVKFVRETLIAKLDSLPENHREMVKLCLGL